MLIKFDPAKDAINIAKHGVSLADAERLEWDWLRSRPDTSHGEFREVGFAPIGESLYCIVFVQIDDEVYRVISLRNATKREITDYVRTLKDEGL